MRGIREPIISFNQSTRMCPTKLWIIFIAAVLALFIIETTESASTEKRTNYRPKRTAVFSLPNSGNFGVRWTQQVIVPVLAMINQTNTYLWFDLQMYTKMPQASNISALYQSFGRSMGNDGHYIDEDFLEDQIANKERKIVYQYIESFLSNFGLNGKACVKRIICETSEAPLSGNGLFGQIVELVLTPSLTPMPKEMEPHFGPNRTRREVDPELEILTLPVEDEYTEAYRRGKEGLCWSHYAACSVNIIKLLTF